MRHALFAILAACNGGLRPLDTATTVAGETDADTDPGGGPDGDTDPGPDTDAGSDTDAVDTGSPIELPPCTFLIPRDAEVVAGNTSRGDDGAVFWVCRNKTLSYAGDGATVYLEQGADLVTSGAGNTVYAIKGAEMHDFGDANTFVVGDPVDVVDESASGATVEVCPGLAFDDRRAPSPGC